MFYHVHAVSKYLVFYDSDSNHLLYLICEASILILVPNELDQINRNIFNHQMRGC